MQKFANYQSFGKLQKNVNIGALFCKWTFKWLAGKLQNTSDKPLEQLLLSLEQIILVRLLGIK